MTDNELCFKLWRLAAIALCTVVLTLGSCTTYSNYKIGDMVSKGTDPIKASCAINGFGDAARAVVCIK
jgi:hypothetical protein